MTGDPLTLQDLIPIKVPTTGTSRPRQPVPTTSLPGLMASFQNEWDSLILETYNLKKQLETSRLELSHALYQNDAACRVIARLVAERDSSRRELETLRLQVGGGGAQFSRMDIDGLQGLDNDTKNSLTAKSQELSSERKTREPSANLATPERIKAFKLLNSYPPHKASSPGILSVDVHPISQELTLTGGVDRTAILFDRSSEKKIATLSGHTKEVTCTLFHIDQDLLVTASADTTVRVWSPSTTSALEDTHTQRPYRSVHVISRHKDEVVQVSLHATHDYFASASRDHSWAFHNLETGVTLIQVMEPDESPLTCTMLHPDGLILATGTDGHLIRIWDLKSQKNVATFQGHKGAITDLRFSENGYYLATSAADNQLKLWDLRGPKNINSLKLDVPVKRLDYDYSGKYLAAAIGKEIRIFTGKHLEHVTTIDAHSDTVTDVKWGADAAFLVSTSMDRSLKFWKD